MNDHVQVGIRVVVQLGRSKLYTAIVRNVHESPPSGYEARYIESILDESPLVNEHQLKFWEWLAEYYMCYIGEVMSAALPSSLKLASETKVVMDTSWDGDISEILIFDEALSTTQKDAVIEYLKNKWDI